MSKKRTNEIPFSLEIKGAGTRQEILDNLQIIITEINQLSDEELMELDLELHSLVAKTDTFESYTGYPHSKEDEQL